jgi:hypothetical protein
MTKRSTVRQAGIATKDMEETSKVLESIASKFSKRSKEYKALELAAKALHFAYQRESNKKFVAFVQNFDSDLTSEQRKKLRSLGIDA